MKTKEELNALKEKAETVSKKLHELTEDELTQVIGGFNCLFSCDEWERKPGPFIIDDEEYCLDCKYRKIHKDGTEYCEKGRQ